MMPSRQEKVESVLPVTLGGIIGCQFLEVQLKRLVETIQAMQEVVMDGKLDRGLMGRLWTQARDAREEMITLFEERDGH